MTTAASTERNTIAAVGGAATFLDRSLETSSKTLCHDKHDGYHRPNDAKDKVEERMIEVAGNKVFRNKASARNIGES